MTNEIVKQEPQAPIIRTMEDAERAARAMSASGFFQETKQASQAVVKILAGQELGFGPFASMTGVNIIQNKPVLAANLMAAAVKRGGKYNYRVTKHSETECEIAFFEGGQEVGKSAFTMHDAEQAGLVNKDNWKKYPRNMLFARALSNGQKWYAPDVFNGATVYTPDEMGAVEDADGNIVETPRPEVELQAKLEPGMVAPENDNGHKPTKTNWQAAQVKALIYNKAAKNEFDAVGMLALSCLTPDSPVEDVARWGAAYRELRPYGTKDPTAKDAATHINSEFHSALA